jgi:hypothetical protein
VIIVCSPRQGTTCHAYITRPVAVDSNQCKELRLNPPHYTWRTIRPGYETAGRTNMVTYVVLTKFADRGIRSFCRRADCLEAATAFPSGFASISANMTRMPASAKAWSMASPMPRSLIAEATHGRDNASPDPRFAAPMDRIDLTKLPSKKCYYCGTFQPSACSRCIWSKGLRLAPPKSP